jgi:RHH-type proline utilization regulon transcriptional repressor/proline dehydrogenase/delta 1-pyrroline-5-carboxylate dehydrogenase
MTQPTRGDHDLSSSELIATSTIDLVRSWLAVADSSQADPTAQRLGGVLRDPNGLAFTLGFVDGVMRPEDLRVAARTLAKLVPLTPRFLPAPLRAAIAVGGAVGRLLPWLVVPIARRVLRQMVGHLVLDARPARLGPAIGKLRAGGDRLNLNLLGEAVLGDREAGRRLQGTADFLARDDVDYVSIKVSSVVSQLSMWSFDETVEKVVARLTPLYEQASAAPTPKFINLDMEEYRDLDLTIAVFARILDQPQLKDLEAGIVLQAYLPDALGAMRNLTTWALRRHAAGGAPIKVRVVKGANLAMERVDAELHGWPLATYGVKQHSDTNYKRVLDWALRPENTRAVRVGIAGHNLFDIAWSWLLAGERGVRDAVEYEMLLGMATGQAAAVRAEVGNLLLYTPVVNPAEFDVAIAYLVRRLEENASSDNFMSAVFDLNDERLFARERDRFLASLADLDDTLPTPNRIQNRDEDAQQRIADARGETFHAASFANEPDTDPALDANRGWARAILDRSPATALGMTTIRASRVDDARKLQTVITDVQKAGAAWGSRPAAERAAILHQAGVGLAARRAELLEIMAHEAGKTIAEGDPEVSEAIDFAHYYAKRAVDLEKVRGARFEPARLTVVTPPWNFPVAIPAGSVLAALAAGSGVIIKPAKLTQRCGAVMVEALWEAGVPREVLALVDLASHDLGRQLVGAPEVDRVILTGAYETAAMFRSFRHDLPLLAETSGKNAIVITPSADLDLAAADLAKSAFGHAGQKCSAASLAILVGSVATSERFRNQLVDAVTSLRVGYPSDPRSVMGPLVEPASGKLLHALTTLDAGERWLVEPHPGDQSGRLWSPGIRTGVAPGSAFHLTEYFGPVLGIMTARTLDDAIELQNAVDYGLTAGLHSLDPAEQERWLDKVQAGNLYVNRGITGAIVQRQPFGGWKRSAVGAGAKAGGPNYLFGLGTWIPVEPTEVLEREGLMEELDPLVRRLAITAEGLLEGEELTRFRRAVVSDAAAWATEFGIAQDRSGLELEHNIFRYRPTTVSIRLADDADPGDALRVVAAGVLARATLTVSTANDLSAAVRETIVANGGSIISESDVSWLQRAAEGAIGSGRVRIVGGARLSDLEHLFHEAIDGSPDYAVWAHPVTEAGRVELLPFLLEQAISITAHRFGNPTPTAATVVLGYN